jgi:hypothetical protein
MSFSPRCANTKIKPQTFKQYNKEFSRLLLIASEMYDPTHNPHDLAYRGVAVNRKGCSSSVSSIFTRAYHRTTQVFTRLNWSKWLWSKGWVESRLEISQLQANLIHNKFIKLVKDNTNLDKQMFVVCRKIRLAARKEDGIMQFESPEPIFELDGGNDGILYSIRHNGERTREVRLSSKAVIQQGLQKGYFIRNDKLLFEREEMKKGKTKKKKKIRKEGGDNSKILYILQRDTQVFQQYDGGKK